MSTNIFRRYIDMVSESAPQGVAEGLPQTLRKVVPGYAKREIDKKMDAGKFGKTDADKDANFQRYKKIQDKLKEQGVAEGKVSGYKMYPNHDGTWYVEDENENVVLRNASKGEAEYAVWTGNEKLKQGVAEGSLEEVSLDLAKRARDKAEYNVDMDLDDMRDRPEGYSEKQRSRFQRYIDRKEPRAKGDRDWDPAIKDKRQGVAEDKRTLRDYIAESEHAWSKPVPGDYFAINIREETLFETWVCDETNDGIVIFADETGMRLLEQHGYLGDAVMEQHGHDDFEADSDGSDVDVVDQGEYDFEGDQAKDQLRTIVRAARRLNGMLDDDDNLPEWVQMKITKAEDYIDTAADYMESNREQGVAEGDMAEAKYQGREVPLGKPMAGDVKKSKVYVRGPKGNVVKVNFGQKGMKIKKSIPGRRKNFRARHNCDNPGPRWKARYWSCRAW